MNRLPGTAAPPNLHDVASTIAHPLRMRGRAVPAAVAVALLSAVATSAGLLAVVRAGSWPLLAATDAPVDAVVGAIYAGMGAIVLAGRRRSRRLGWLLVGMGVAGALTVLTTCAAVLAEQPTAAARLAVHLQSWLWVPAFIPLLTLVPLLYPDGRLVSPRWRPAVPASVLAMVLLAAGTALHPQSFSGTVAIAKPWTSEPAARIAFPVGVVLLLGCTVVALASLAVRLRRSTGLERRQVVVLLGAAAAVAGSALAWPLLPSPAGALLQAGAVALPPVAIAVAVTRHRLYDLDLAVCRALVVTSLAACLAGAYLTLFLSLRAALPGRPVIASALAAAATGLLVHPLAVRLARGVDRLFYGQRADPYAVLADLSARLREGLDPTDVPATICRTVVESLRLGSAELRLEPRSVPDGVEATAASAGTPVASAGRPAGEPTVFALRHRGEPVGCFLVTPRAGERNLHPRDRDLLEALADQAAPALAALRLTDDLRRSREALVAAREEERRRLRRDLHDGVGAALAGVRLQLDAARDLVEDDRAARILSAAVAGVAEAVSDVRRITEDLRPPALDELGLAASLTALGDRLRTPALDVTVQVPELPALPAATEVAAYRVAAEALANAARHSGASRVELDVAVPDGALTLRVRDDGRGVDEGSAAARKRGGSLGLGSMRQRAEEIGGTWDLTSSAEGTTVRAVLPR